MYFILAITTWSLIKISTKQPNTLAVLQCSPLSPISWNSKPRQSHRTPTVAAVTTGVTVISVAPPVNTTAETESNDGLRVPSKTSEYLVKMGSIAKVVLATEDCLVLICNN